MTAAALAAPNTLTEAQALRSLRKRLLGLAASFGFIDDSASDMAADAMAIAFRKGELEFFFAAGVLKNLILREKKDRVKRKPVEIWDDDPDPHPKLVSPATQESAAELAQTLRLIDRLAEPDRTIMRMVAEEWEGAEIARQLGLPIREVNYIITRSRGRMRDGTEERRIKDGRHGYVGLCRCRRKWRAAVKKGGINYVAGYYYDPKEAAEAYDALARSLGVPESKLNFPLRDDAA